jgi:hypothetical protein
METSAFRWRSDVVRCSRKMSASSRRRTAPNAFEISRTRSSEASSASAVVPSSPQVTT